MPFHSIAVWADTEAGRVAGSRGIFWPLVVLGTIVAAGIVLVVWMDRWRKRPAEISLTPAEQMARFQELFDRGELNQQEFDRIKAKLSKGSHLEPPVPPQVNGSSKP